jgi:hypothetical protein
MCIEEQRPTLPYNRRSRGDYCYSRYLGRRFAATLVMTCARMVFRTCLVSSAAEKAAAAHEPWSTAGHDAKQLEPGDRREQLFFVDSDGELTAMQKGRAVTPLRSAGDARNRLAPCPCNCFSLVAGARRRRRCDQEPKPKIIHARLRLTTSTPQLTIALHAPFASCRPHAAVPVPSSASVQRFACS